MTDTGLLWTIIIIAVIAFWIVMAIRSIIKERKQGGCSACVGGCSGCGTSCSGHDADPIK